MKMPVLCIYALDIHSNVFKLWIASVSTDLFYDIILPFETVPSQWFYKIFENKVLRIFLIGFPTLKVQNLDNSSTFQKAEHF